MNEKRLQAVARMLNEPWDSNAVAFANRNKKEDIEILREYLAMRLAEVRALTDELLREIEALAK